MNERFYKTRIIPVFLVFSLFLAPVPLLAAQQATESVSDQAISADNLEIAIDELELRLKPLTRDGLEIEVEAWLMLLRSTVEELSNAEIATKQKRREIKTAEEVQEALEDVQKTAEAMTEDADTQEKVSEYVEEAKEAVKQAIEAEQETKQSQGVQESIEAAAEKAKSEEQNESKGPAADKDELKPKETTVEKLDVEDVGVEDKEKLTQVTEAISEAVDDKAEVKSQLLDRINELRAKRTGIIDRTNAVIMAFEEKGGDEKKISVHRKYIAAVSGIEVDVSDVGTAWATIYGWLASEEGGIRWAKNMVVFIVTILIFYLLSNAIGKALDRVISVAKGVPELLGVFIIKGVRRLVLIVGLIVGLAALEVNIGPLLAVIGALGFVIAFALQNSLSNFASGILILIYRPFDVGDVVDVSGVSGKVDSMNLLSTYIKTFDNKLVIVPNNSIWGGIITNATGSDQRRVDMVFGIGYQDSMETAQAILEDIVNSHKLVLQDPSPVIKVNELADSSVNFICRPWAKTEDYWTVYWDITRAVKERFDKEGVSIPFPQQDIHVHNVPAVAGTAS